jgi:hypothetical protein
LSAFASAVLDGEQVITSAADAVANMSVLDDIYHACGLPLPGEANQQ